MKTHVSRTLAGSTLLRGGYHHSPSQHRLLRVRALLPPAGLLEGGGRSRHPSSILPYFLVSSLV